ncbi:MAG: hypothetical protein JXR70_17615 [Spirochaetales bacterium]|nr:hypothetical protein [Spirochaetales bacterium]
MALPNDRKYTQDHLWVKPEGENYLLGITETALELMGEINQVQFSVKTGPQKKEQIFCSIESEKTVIDLVTPAKGDIVEINKKLEDDASSLANNIYETWLIKMVMAPADYQSLLSAGEYKQG